MFCGEHDLLDNLCAAGEYHSGVKSSNSAHVDSITEKWKKMALELGELDIHAVLLRFVIIAAFCNTCRVLL